jgi:hypothetical protein
MSLFKKNLDMKRKRGRNTQPSGLRECFEDVAPVDRTNVVAMSQLAITLPFLIIENKGLSPEMIRAACKYLRGNQ